MVPVTGVGAMPPTTRVPLLDIDISGGDPMGPGDAASSSTWSYAPPVASRVRVTVPALPNTIGSLYPACAMDGSSIAVAASIAVVRFIVDSLALSIDDASAGPTAAPAPELQRPLRLRCAALEEMPPVGHVVPLRTFDCAAPRPPCGHPCKILAGPAIVLATAWRGHQGRPGRRGCGGCAAPRGRAPLCQATERPIARTRTAAAPTPDAVSRIFRKPTMVHLHHRRGVRRPAVCKRRG